MVIEWDMAKKKTKYEKDFSDLDLEIDYNQKTGKYYGFLRVNGFSVTYTGKTDIEVFDYLVDMYLTNKKNKENGI